VLPGSDGRFAVFYDDAVVLVPAPVAFRVLTAGVGGGWSAPANVVKARRRSKLFTEMRSLQPTELADRYDGSVYGASELARVRLTRTRLNGRELVFESTDGSGFQLRYPARHVQDDRAKLLLTKVVGDRFVNEIT
jgi:hypothetical protein